MTPKEMIKKNIYGKVGNEHLEASGSGNQLKKGSQIELEHKATYLWLKKYIAEEKGFPSLEDFAASIAKDHLKEHRDYYDKLVEAGL